MHDFINDPFIQARPGASHKVSEFNPSYSAGLNDKNEAVSLLASNVNELIKLQEKLYADNRYSVLLVFQAMDAAGKDGTIKHVMSGLNPQGTQVFSFKAPTDIELDHDYLWRTYRYLPHRGNFGIFNRSYYEEVLIVKVHPEFLIRQRLPGVDTIHDAGKDFWKMRYRQINAMERHLSENGVIILKFFLNVSKNEQKERFLKRIVDESRNWKFSSTDIAERQYWDDYMQAYSDMLSNTSTEVAPWYVIPADKKWFMRYAVSSIILSRLKTLDLRYPILSKSETIRLAEAKQMLQSENL
ncbi:MAG: polyphosphate kinase 2 family protein [Bacteroidales bacterium]|nr:polyphosphate kinase 2 family protein [Bacteroidales bacterium]